MLSTVLVSSHELNLAANVIFAIGFIVLGIASFVFGVRYRTIWYSSELSVGLFLEAVGFIGKALLQTYSTDKGLMVLFLIGSVLGPVFICQNFLHIQFHVIEACGIHTFIKARAISHALSVLMVAAVLVDIVGIVLLALSDDTREVRQYLLTSCSRHL